MGKYLDLIGLGYLIEKIQATFIKKTDTIPATSLAIDTTPTNNSDRLITSGGVKAALDTKQDTIDSSHKLSADLILDGTTNKVYTFTEKSKLAGIADGAEVNVQPDWNAIEGDGVILNKPNIPTNVSQLTNDVGYLTSYTETDPTVPAWAKASTKPTYTYSEVGAADKQLVFGTNFSQAPIFPYIHILSSGDILILNKFGYGLGETIYLRYDFPAMEVLYNQKMVRIAGINSPALEGTPTAPTAAAGTNTTQIATTEFVQNIVDSKIADIPDPVKPDWNATPGSPAEILNKPIIPSNEPIDYSLQYLTFVALEDGTFTLTIGSGIGTTLLTSVSYSTDDGETWTTTNNQDSTEVVITTPTITKGNKVLWKGTGTAMSTVTKNTASADRPTYASIFSSSGNFDAEGNIMSLLFGDNFSSVTSFAENSSSNFAALFYSYNISTVAKIVNTNNLILPVTTLTPYCYCYIFQECTTLKTPPELPAMTMAEGCYRNIFTNCTNLTIAPELPATTLADYCYLSLFYGCKSLKEAPKLPATTMTSDCYEYMFMDCSSLVTAPELPATTLANYCYCQMFKNCSSLTTAPKLSATTLVPHCYSSMFYGCSSLTTVPELPATTLVNDCYNGMFSYCNSLTVLPNKLLPATTVTTNCYRCMFQFCSSLTTAPELPATTLADYCYAGMFQDCYSLVIVPSILPATTLTSNCYLGMFKNCTSLTTAPELPAITLVSNCYKQLFNGCTSLNYIKAMFTTTPGTSYTNTWTKDVAVSGTFIKSEDAQWSVTGDHGIPTNWNTYINDEYEVVRHYELDNLVSSIESILLSI